MTVQISQAAARDIRSILGETLKTFGTYQFGIYQAILNRAIGLVAEAPERPSSIARSDIARNVRSFHLQLSAGKAGGAAHCLYYISARLPDGSTRTIILRVLHEHMEPRYKVVRSLKEFRTDEG